MSEEVDHQRLHQGKIVASSVIRNGGGQGRNRETMSTQARQKLLEVAEQKGATRYDGYETAFKQLADVVDEKVFDNMDIMKMTELRDTSLDNAG